jgi:hypothetical protein
MTGQEFRETGLHKLTDEELAALNRWIRQRSLTLEDYERTERRDEAAADGATTDRRGLEQGQPHPHSQPNRRYIPRLGWRNRV